jgi:hypothetical protein
MTKVAASVLALLVVALSVSVSTAAPYSAPPFQPQATAEAAAATAQAAGAIEAAAWGQATAQAAQATAEAVASASAEARAAATAAAQATATASAVTAEARAFQVQLTRQAADLEATRAAHEMAFTVTAMARAQQAEELALERARALQPLEVYGPWAAFFLLMALVVWGARRLAPAVETYLESQAVDDGGAGRDEERMFVAVGPLDWDAGPLGPRSYAGVPREGVVTDDYAVRAAGRFEV